MKLVLTPLGSLLVMAFGALVPAVWVAAQDDGAPARRDGTAARLDAAAVDRFFERAWTAAGVEPAETASDGEWIRRAYLTLNGVTPTADEVDAFLRNPSPDKRARVIDDLLARPEYARHFGGIWIRLMVGRRAQGQRFDRGVFEDWVEQQFAENRPFDTLVRDVIGASGSHEDNPAVGFVERWRTNQRGAEGVKDLAGHTAKTFLGLQVQCARCHDHKYEQWKQEEFNDFAAYFGLTDVRRRGDERTDTEVFDKPEREISSKVKERNKKRLEQRMKGKENAQAILEAADIAMATPRPLRPLEEGPLASPLEPTAGEVLAPQRFTNDGEELTRRQQLAAWMTTPGNPYFARATANRIFSELFGYGLVNPIDDFVSDSVVLVPGLLDALALELERSAYDYRAMVKLLASTRAFSLSSSAGRVEPVESMKEREKVFARFPARPMTADQLFDSLVRATGLDEAAEKRAKNAKGLGKKGAERAEKMAEGYSKLREAMLRKFLSAFDDDEQAEAMDMEGTIPQALLMMNGRVVTDGIQKGFTLARVLEKGSGNDRLDWLYMAVLSRKPTTDERMKALSHFQKAKGEREACEDILWVLLNSAEFSVVH